TLTKAFIPLQEANSFTHEAQHGQASVSVSQWLGGTYEQAAAQRSTWGYLQTGEAVLFQQNRYFQLYAGMYFSAAGSVRVEGEGTGVFIVQTEQRALFTLGGPVEEKGRLQYIDGCTDSLLIAPPVWGDPCLNLLHIPPHTSQSQHTHPSLRAGMIISGRGHCLTPEGRYPLAAGLTFVIPAGAQHSFITSDEALRVIAFHPDSDFGPTHEHHPMINRTYLKSTNEVS
ncbi:MAG: cupin domain-containing protein, partial [Bacteroidota bacterium]